MSSERRIQASRANGAKSKGPVTPEGKKRSSQNAIKHGVLAKNVVTQFEDKEDFLDLLDSFINRFQPADEVEFGLVEDMVVAKWRIRRLNAWEGHMIDTEIQNPGDDPPYHAFPTAYVTLAESVTYPHLVRHESRLHHIFRRSLDTLLRLRKECPAPETENCKNEPIPISEHRLEPSPERLPSATPTADSEAGSPPQNCSNEPNSATPKMPPQPVPVRKPIETCCESHRPVQTHLLGGDVSPQSRDRKTT